MESLDSIAGEIKKCTRCDLCLKRQNAVPGEGDPHSKIVIIGEGPGKNEDLQGRPFIGMSGKFLTKYLEKAGITREKVFITNAVKCRPPNNRKPKAEELDKCRPFLSRQLAAIKPTVILALGTSAASALGIKFKHLSEIKSRTIEIELEGRKFNCFVTFHPSFPMRFPRARDGFLKDIRSCINVYNNLSTT
jgi:DNA polymerase